MTGRGACHKRPLGEWPLLFIITSSRVSTVPWDEKLRIRCSTRSPTHKVHHYRTMVGRHIWKLRIISTMWNSAQVRRELSNYCRFLSQCIGHREGETIHNNVLVIWSKCLLPTHWCHRPYNMGGKPTHEYSKLQPYLGVLSDMVLHANYQISLNGSFLHMAIREPVGKNKTSNCHPWNGSLYV